MQDSRNRAPCQNSTLCDFPDEVVLDLTGFGVLECLRAGLFAGEGCSTLDLVLIHLRFLPPDGGRVLQLGNKELFINMGNGVADQLGAVKIDGVGVLMVDLTPKRLKLFLGKVLVKRIFLNLGFVTVGEHILEDAVIIDCLNERVDAVCHRPQFLR